MPRIVHLGGGKTVITASSAFDDPTFARPSYQHPTRFKLDPGKRHRAPRPRMLVAPVTDRECTWSSDGGCREPHEPGKHYCKRHDALAHGRKP
jgi:hypothetical protein